MFGETRFLNRLQAYLTRTEGDSVESAPRRLSTTRTITNNYYTTNNYGDPWAWWWMTPSYRPTVVHHYHHDKNSRPKRDDEENENKDVTFGRILGLGAVMGLSLGGFYYLYNKYLDYSEEVELSGEVEEYRQRHPYLYMTTKKYFDNLLNYRRDMLLSQFTMIVSGIGLLCDLWYWNDEFIMYLTTGTAFAGAMYGTFQYLNYGRSGQDERAREIYQHVDAILKQD